MAKANLNTKGKNAEDFPLHKWLAMGGSKEEWQKANRSEKKKK